MVKSLCFQCRGYSFDAWLGNWKLKSHMPWRTNKKIFLKWTNKKNLKKKELGNKIYVIGLQIFHHVNKRKKKNFFKFVVYASLHNVKLCQWRALERWGSTFCSPSWFHSACSTSSLSSQGFLNIQLLQCLETNSIQVSLAPTSNDLSNEGSSMRLCYE